jgi:hypothetical protein
MTNDDSMRDKLDFQLYCSNHPNERLNFSSQLSSIGASSAYEVNLKLVVHPCPKCQYEIDKITNAVSVLIGINNKKT